MVNKVRTLDFLPEIFRTTPNEEFLGATLDQLVQAPVTQRVEGYIGRKFEYGIDPNAVYVKEPNSTRQNYQLEPGVVFTKPETSVAKDFISYPGLLDAIKTQNGIIDNHSLLFRNEFYSWDSFVDLDKVVNFSQYYWLPDGPDQVPVTTEIVNSEADFTIISDSTVYAVRENFKRIPQSNPTLKVVRGGTYKFIVNQNSNFWIQTDPGINGRNPIRPNLTSREIYGVENNGTNAGIIEFTVPQASDQDEWIFPGENYVDLISDIPISELHGKKLSEVLSKYPKGMIDGINQIRDKRVIFLNYKPGQIVELPTPYDLYSLEEKEFDDAPKTIPNNNYYKIKFLQLDSDFIISIDEDGELPVAEKITAINGKKYISQEFVRLPVGEIAKIPVITAPLDTLYYQDESTPNKVGTIKILDAKVNNAINIETDIIGKLNYTGPNGVKFTNGLKVNFVGNIIPAQYKTGSYYVEGVGTGIKLIKAEDLNVVEPFGQLIYTIYDNEGFDTLRYGGRTSMPSQKDYITINRSAINKNAWSRSNRWFHIDVLKATAEYTSGDVVLAALNNKENRANRPILEFYPELKLFDSGTMGKGHVDFVDTTTTDVMNSNPTIGVVGRTEYYPDGNQYKAIQGSRVIFANDSDPNVRNKIFVINFASINESTEPTIVLTKAADGDVLDLDQVYVNYGTTNGGKSFYFDKGYWNQAQQKTYVNQPPLFDIFDKNNISLADKEFYPGSNFIGCTLFEFKPGVGDNDPVLGFPIAYSSVANIGDISFRISLNEDVFKYSLLTGPVTEKVSVGYPHRYKNRYEFTKELGWVKTVGESFQYQAYNFTYNPILRQNSFTCKTVVIDQKDSPWPVIKVSVNENILTSDQYTVTKTDKETIVTLLNPPATESPVEVLIHSEGPLGEGAYYTIPINLSSNPFNTPITSLSLGDIRNHYQTIFVNSQKLNGQVFGSNNYRDAGNLITYGDKIIQNSAPLIYAAACLRNKNFNLFDALTYSANEYVNFKLLITSIIETVEYSGESAADLLDLALQQIASYKDQNTSFFWSDMIPSRAPFAANTYTFNAFIDTSFFPLTKTYDFSKASYDGILIYLTRETEGETRITQLLRNRDYTISQDEPKVIITLDLEPGDKITIKEYNQTYGSFVPNTPTKLGLYPLFEPKVVYDDTYVFPAYFIQGHDGSYTRIYGKVSKEGTLLDFRDRVLFEFECRVYNNVKLNVNTFVANDDVLSGYFRKTDFSYEFTKNLYTTYFLNWIGQHRVDYKTQYFLSDNQFTYNLDQCKFKLDGEGFKQGNWRGIYLHLYDTTTPHKTPWEMLGFVTKPKWWDERYGAAPYTYDNKILWEDLENGVVYNDGDTYTIPTRKRPGLSKIIPVNSEGKLRNPLDFLTTGTDQPTYDRGWNAGDYGPQEFSYYKSSTYPFDLIKILAIARPAKFFALRQNLDLYNKNSEFDQWLINDRNRIEKSFVNYGSGTAQHGYINWIVDYVQSFGLNGNATLKEFLDNLDVRLVYRLAGFSDKDLLKFYLEKSSAGSKSNSLLIPDDSFALMLYENEPYDRVIYSSVIVQKTNKGFKVYGNSQNKSYFVQYTPNYNGNYKNITVLETTLYVSENFYKNEIIVPYGTEFLSLESLAEFIINYGRYLENQGMKFTNIEEGIEINWQQMVAELIYWNLTGWEAGSTININPSANGLVIDKENAVVQPLTLFQQNYALNQNLIPIQLKDLVISRKGTEFTLQTLNTGDSVSYFTANMSTIEHGIVFDNYTQFNDTIYNPITGLRQHRILMKGTKTAEWKGTLDTNGFILNQDNIKDWQPNQRYIKGEIVYYKNSYWMASDRISAEGTFNQNKWIKSDYDKIQKGLLPNASNRSLESELYYDTTNTNLESDANLLAFGLIGYRPRDYLNASNLDDISQVNIYKNIISEKGTRLIADAVQNITLTTGKISYDVYENWALKVSEFGGVENENFVEFIFDESKLTGNPAIVGIVDNMIVPNVMQSVPLNSVINYGRPFSENKIAPVIKANYIEKLPSAGYVHFDDVRIAGYSISSLKNNPITANDVNMDDYIWVADDKDDWLVNTAISISEKNATVKVVEAVNNLDGTITLAFENQHNLVLGNHFILLKFDYRVDGYYEVKNVPTLNTITIEVSLPSNVLSIVGEGIVAKFQNQRVHTPSSINNLQLINSGFSKAKVWVDEDTDGTWAVYQKSINYKKQDITKPNATGKFGSAIAHHSKLGYFVSDAAQGKIYRYQPDDFEKTKYKANEVIDKFLGTTVGVGFGTQIAIAQDTMIVTKPGTNSTIYVYQTKRSRTGNYTDKQATIILSARVGDAIALSGDANWLYVSSHTVSGNFVRTYKKTAAHTYEFVKTYNLGGDLQDFSKITLSTNYNGSKLFIGAPLKNYGTPPNQIVNVGMAAVLNRVIEKIDVKRDYVESTEVYYNLSISVPTSNHYLDVFVNGKLIDNTKYQITASGLQFLYDLKAGDVIEIAYPDLVKTQEFQLTNLAEIRPGNSFGHAIDTNRHGSELLIGVPFFVSEKNLEGLVVRYTNYGKKYGIIQATNNYSLASSSKILINGYQVTLPTNLTGAVNAINDANIINVYAKAVDNKLVIGLVDPNLGPIEEKLTIQALNSTTLQQIGILEYQESQRISDPENVEGASQFGFSIKFNEYNSVAIGAPTSTRKSLTTFDFTDDLDTTNDTIFDNNYTKFVDELGSAGSVYIYDYLANHNESADKLGKFVYAQAANDTTLDIGANPHYGKVLEFKDYNLIIGCPDYKPNIDNGRIVFYQNNQNVRNWNVLRKSNDVIDINRLQNIQIFNAENNERIESLDYIDPLQGKLLGVVTENIDYISSQDPAGYNSQLTTGNLVWGDAFVGKIWFDTSTTKFLNYHQENVLYNAQNWGKIFPGSTVTVYTWIESNVLPVNYQGPGTPYNIEYYTSLYNVDSSGALVNKYYYWVRNTNTLSSDKTLTDTIIEQYITDPQSSGIGYFAALQNNVYGLFNAVDSIKGKSTGLHIGFTDRIKKDDSYNEFKLIKDGNPNDFLPGVPSAYTAFEMPESLYDKLLDSLSGIDERGNLVPDIHLPKLLQQGIKVRPRQSFFSNRLKALENYCKYVNSVLIKHPISEILTPSFIAETNKESVPKRAPGFLTTSGEFFNTQDYWEHVYWWADGYNNNTKTDVEVLKYYDLATLSPFENMLAGVTTNSDGKREVYVYTNGDWVRVGLEQGTIQIKESLWNYELLGLGFGNTFYDTDSFDVFPHTETRYIVRSVTEEIFVNELLIHRNKSLITLFEYIVSEATSTNCYLTWLNKTSLVDVTNTLRELKADLNYRSDNQDFLQGYLKEIKPYHVVMKEFAIKYTANDTFDGQITDFDLPAQYDFNLGKFITPNLTFFPVTSVGEFGPTDAIWNRTIYFDWLDNYGLSLTGQKSVTIGSLTKYITPVSEVIYIDNAYGLPVNGVVKINNEYIGYAGIDRDAGKLTFVSRGLRGSVASDHNPNSKVIIDLPEVLVLNTGRDYIDVPTVAAYIDTTKYPAPLREAVLEPVMADDKVIGVKVIDSGAGYAATPEIIIQASKTFKFNSSVVNFLVNTINIDSVDLNTGDVVRFVQGEGSSIKGLTNRKYYYVRVLYKDEVFGNKSIIALYSTAVNAQLDNHRINFIDIGPSTDNKLELTARAVAIASNTPTREISTKLKFDRTSYVSKVTEWKSGEFYASEFAPSGDESSTSSISASGSTLASVQHRVFDIQDVILEEVTNEVSVSIDYTGSSLSPGQLKGLPLYFYVVPPTYMYPQHVDPTDVIIGKHYKILSLGDTNWNFMAGTTGITYSVGNKIVPVNKGLGSGVLTAFVNANEIVLNKDYVIVELGNTDWNQIAGTSGITYQVGNEIYSINAGTGTGKAMELGHALIKFYRPNFVFNRVYNEYFVEVFNKGAIYNVGDRITVDGSYLGGASGVNDAIIKVVYTQADRMELYELTGLSVGAFRQYYLKPTTQNELKVYYDAPMIRPVIASQVWKGNQSYKRGDIVLANGRYYRAIVNVEPTTVSARSIVKDKSYYVKTVGLINWTTIGADTANELAGTEPFTATANGNIFIDASAFVYLNEFNPAGYVRLEDNPFPFDNNSYMYLPEPVQLTSGYSRTTSSIVSLNNRLYKCLVSNNDTVFDFDKWQVLDSNVEELNALDRIVGFYQPTINMPGKNLPLLLTGVDYPNNTYYSNKFDENYTVDTQLKDQPFYPKDIKIKSVLWDNEKYLAVADGRDYSMILLSYDEGITWQIKRISADVLEVSDVIHSGTHYVLTTRKPSNPIFISYDGLSWLGLGSYTPYDKVDFDEPGEAWDSSSLTAPSGGLYNVASHNDFYVAAGDQLVASTDAYAWDSVYTFQSITEARANYIDYITSQFYAGFIAVGYGLDVIENSAEEVSSQVTAVGRVLLSENGRTWTPIYPHPTNNGLNTVVGGPEMIALGGDNGTVLYSTNMQNIYAGTIEGDIVTDNILAGCYASNTFVFVGQNGLILVSYDGMTWSKVNSGTNQNLNSVTHDGQHFLAVGNNATILRSWEGLDWQNVSAIGGASTFYEVKGDAFTSGYGPEEMVPGAITDQFSMTVITRSGSTWDSEVYQHNGYKVIANKVFPDSVEIDFSNFSQSPAQLAVFIMDPLSNFSRMIYPNTTANENNEYTYSVDWIQKKITLNKEIRETEIVLVEVYEFGNGNQLVRATSDDIPVTIDESTGHSQIIFNVKYEELLTADPIVYINGEKKIFTNDYIVASTDNGRTKLLFDRVYDPTTNFISFVLFGSTIQNYGYALPETQVFEFDSTGQTDLALDYQLIENENDYIPRIVRVNGLELPITDYTITIGPVSTLSITPTLNEGDIISITTFNDTREQYFLQETISTLRVTPLLSVAIDKDVVFLYITTETDEDPSLATGDLIQIDGIVGTNQLNNNTYYMKLETKFSETFTEYDDDGTEISYTKDVYPITLWFNDSLSRPVTSRFLSEYVRGGFIWKYSDTHVIPQTIDITDETRLHVTVNGVRLGSDGLKLNDGNYLSILADIKPDDVIMITSMVSSATPNEMIYVNEVDKNGDQFIYRANSSNRTWLTENLEPLQDVIHVKDVSKVIDIVSDTYFVVQADERLLVRIKYDLETIKETEVYNETTLTKLNSSDFTLLTNNSVAYLVFRNGVSEGDEINVVMRLGDVININGEKIRYSKVDYQNNTISNLKRGIQGTAINKMHLKYSSVVGITPSNTLFNFYYNRSWNSEIYDDISGDPLQISDSIPAKFLQQGTK